MIIKEIQNRKSVREYENKEVSEKDILEIIKAGQFAPTAKGIKAIEFIVVREQKTKDEIFGIVGQDFVKTANVLIVPVIDTKKTSFVVQDLSVASENMFLQATAFGLGSVWKNVRPEWKEGVKKILNIPASFDVINIIPVGYPKEKPASRTDADFNENAIHKEKW